MPFQLCKLVVQAVDSGAEELPAWCRAGAGGEAGAGRQAGVSGGPGGGDEDDEEDPEASPGVPNFRSFRSDKDVEEARVEEEQWMRRIAQVVELEGATGAAAAKVTDYLFLGGRSAATEVCNENSLRVTHLCNLVEPWCALGPNAERLAYLGVECSKGRGTDLLEAQRYSRIRAFVESAKAQPEMRCLVHCDRGVNRSAAVCAALLMDLEDMTLIEAVRHLKTQRGAILGDKGFRRQLVRHARRTGRLARDHMPRRSSSSALAHNQQQQQHFPGAEPNNNGGAPADPAAALQAQRRRSVFALLPRDRSKSQSAAVGLEGGSRPASAPQHALASFLPAIPAFPDPGGRDSPDDTVKGAPKPAPAIVAAPALVAATGPP